MSWLVFMYGVEKKNKGSVQNHGGRSARWLVLVSGCYSGERMKITGMCLLNSL